MTATRKLIDFLRDVRRTLIKRTRVPSIGKVDLGSLDRVTPVSSDWGFDSLVRHLMVLWLIRGHVRDWHFSNWAVIVDLSVSLVVMLLSCSGSFGCIMRSSGTVVM